MVTDNKKNVHEKTKKKSKKNSPVWNHIKMH